MTFGWLLFSYILYIPQFGEKHTDYYNHHHHSHSLPNHSVLNNNRVLFISLMMAMRITPKNHKYRLIVVSLDKETAKEFGYDLKSEGSKYLDQLSKSND